MNRALVASLLSVAACYSTPVATPPETFTAAETVPARPTDTTAPLAAVIWTLNYDLREFDTVFTWLETAVPDSPERDRALAAASLIAVAELDRYDALAPALPIFDRAIAEFPLDARLPCWRAYLVYLQARATPDAGTIDASLDGLRAAAKQYPAFTEFGVTLAIGGLELATDDELMEAVTAFDAVVTDSEHLETTTDPLDVSHLRRIWDTPIAPYNLPAMQAMIGDLQLRRADKDDATVAYYTALHANNAARWPWRTEVQRRFDNLDTVATGLTSHPATESSLGSQGKGALGIRAPTYNPRFSGRIGNGSCTVCHTHVSTFDLGESADAVGWVKARMGPVDGLPNAVPTGFLLPSGANAIPAGFGLGPYIDAAGPRDFDTRDALYDGTFIVPAPAGTYFLAIQVKQGDTTYQGYSSREFGKQWFFELEAGELLDLSAAPIGMTVLTQQ
jgi:hypothetical protein